MTPGFVLVTVVAFYLLPSPVQNVPMQDTNSTVEVLMFQEVWGRSFCRTMEKLVEVVQEYPTEVEHIYSPSCVPLVRCAGCCGDENLECHPTETSNVTMQLLKIRPSEPGEEYVEMTFVEHKTCECSIKSRFKIKKGYQSEKNPESINAVRPMSAETFGKGWKEKAKRKRKRKEEKGETKNKRLRQVPDSSQVTLTSTQPPVAAWLTIYLQPGESMKSLHSSIKTCVSAARDS